MEQAVDFDAECAAMVGLTSDLDETVWTTPTRFKGWSPMRILGHLHVWNLAALQSLRGARDFSRFMAPFMENGDRKMEMAEFESLILGCSARERMLGDWKATTGEISALAARIDPAERVEWVGPTMSARSLISARIMEIWAHSQAIYDLLGKVREDTDRIRNVVVMGVNTYGWSFRNRGEAVPDVKPFVDLVAPSGQVWTFNSDGNAERVRGSAVEFCQVVTQCRNIADTRLQVTGPNARRWMEIAQCFAGAPQEPPPPGSRHVETVR